MALPARVEDGAIWSKGVLGVMKVVFLPDFVAYPICYFRMLRKLGPRVIGEKVNYNDYWPYVSVAALGAAIAGDRICDGLDAFVGYSFGAFVAIEAAQALARRGTKTRLHLIDPPDRKAQGSAVPIEVEARLRANPTYHYVFDLIECDLTRSDCVFGNVSFLSDVAEKLQIDLPCSIYIAGDRDGSSAKVEQFRFSHRDRNVVYCPGFNHHDIVDCDVIVDNILRLG